MLSYIYPTLHSWFVLLIFLGQETLSFHDPQYAVILYDMLTHLLKVLEQVEVVLNTKYQCTTVPTLIDR